MSALLEAEAAFDAARTFHDEATQAVSDARTRLADVRQRAADGAATARELGEARDAIELAELTAEAAQAKLPALSEAVAVARAEEEADRISSTLRAPGGDVSRALEAVDEALSNFAAAAVKYDTFVTSERVDIESRCARSPRVVTGRFTQPTIDAIRMVPSNAMAQLATLLLPVARVVGAERPLIDDLTEMARTAPILPRDDR